MQQRTDYELTKNDTKMMQGLAVLAMVCLHLFDTIEFQGKFVPLFYLHKLPLIFYIAQLSDFCVMAFAFCSGYGHMAQYGRPDYYKRRLIGLAGVYINFWIILILFTFISIVVGFGAVMPGSFGTFLRNLTTLKVTYNGAWWYLLTYALITLSSPVLLRLSRCSGIAKTGAVVLLMVILYTSAYYVRFRLHPANWFLYQYGLYGMTAAEYMMGSITYEHRLFSKIGTIWRKVFRNPMIEAVVCVLLLALLLWGRTVWVPSLFAAPFSGMILLFLFQIIRKPRWFQNVFLFLGKHSTNIWLTHMFFYSTLFINLVYAVRIPVLVLAFMLAITIPLSMAIQAVHRPIFGVVKRRLTALLIR